VHDLPGHAGQRGTHGGQPGGIGGERVRVQERDVAGLPDGDPAAVNGGSDRLGGGDDLLGMPGLVTMPTAMNRKASEQPR
jgi:hypothetical protein